ncbi:hypothetical protein VTL71DRAFT_2071 [Oculimacula yallundae]|uniref:Uncharacterized protein n=1 Tax=Oculimacula yallundae TaxID=86028 RepID=A0ABR4C7T9_9HELO
MVITMVLTTSFFGILQYNHVLENAGREYKTCATSKTRSHDKGREGWYMSLESCWSSFFLFFSSFCSSQGYYIYVLLTREKENPLNRAQHKTRTYLPLTNLLDFSHLESAVRRT